MTLVISDLPAAQLSLPQDARLVEADEALQPCIGCFGCWIKTPGLCVRSDRLPAMGPLLASCGRLVVVSRCAWGGYSPAVKRVLDRCIPYLHPDFIVKRGEMHHRQRYRHPFSMSAVFYGDVTDAERKTAQKVVAANAVNFDAVVNAVEFLPDADRLEEYPL